MAGDVFYSDRSYGLAYEAHELFMSGMSAREVSLALGISVWHVYKAVAVVSRNPKPYEDAYARREACR